jgi:hypothetical protein
VLIIQPIDALDGGILLQQGIPPMQCLACGSIGQTERPVNLCLEAGLLVRRGDIYRPIKAARLPGSSFQLYHSGVQETATTDEQNGRVEEQDDDTHGSQERYEFRRSRRYIRRLRR